jgi:lipoprotein-releasing system permease protein
MYLSLKIAYRYFISKKKTSFISIISWLAMVGIAFGTMALVIILSVFNGLEDLNRSLFNTFDSDLIILPKLGKKFEPKSANLPNYQAINEISSITNIIQENALVKYGSEQSIATIKGVDNSFLQNIEFKKSIVDGDFVLTEDSSFKAIIGIGLAQNLSISVENYFTPLEFWYPNKDANLSLATENSFNKYLAQPSGIFSIEQSYDNFVIVPIDLTRRLFERKTEVSAIEININKKGEIEVIKNNIAKILSPNLKILTREEQHLGLLKAIKLEKIFVFIALIFIIAIAALNIFFSLSMLVIEKTEDIKILKAIGANKQLIGNIFRLEGFLIAFFGATLGLVLGYSICFLQIKYGFLKMGMVSALVDAYPVRIELMDFLLTGISIFTITIFISQFPSKKAENIS